MIDLVESEEHIILFADEAVFTVGQTTASTWMAKGQKIAVSKKKAGYSAIAIVTAIDKAGHVVAHELADGAIRIPDFKRFLRNLHRVYRG